MAEETKTNPEKSSLGERMSDVGGMRVYRDGKWIKLSDLAKKETTPITADADYGDKCPPATQDIQLNLKNRQNAIDNVGYGPLNPKEPSLEFWQEKANKWSVSVDDAKKSVCGNCVFFDRRQKTLDCIETGIAEGGSGDESAWDVIDQAELGYCTALDFKCAASRTCNAWAVGGPLVDKKQTVEEAITSAGYIVEEEWDLADALVEIAEEHGKFNEDRTGIWAGYKSGKDNKYAEMGVKCGNCVLYRGGSKCAIIAFDVEPEGKCRFAVIPDGVVDPSKAPIEKEYEEQILFSKEFAAQGNPCWDGYVQVGMKEKNGRMVPNCVPADEASALVSTAGSKPAPKKDKIYGSKKNPKGSASGSKSITFSKKVESSLANKVKEYNEKAPDGRKANLRMLKAVYRRGAGAFSSSHRPDQNRNSWAMARVNAFLHLLKSGSPKNSKYTTDNDLLPPSHPKSSKKSLTAAAYEDNYLSVLSVVLLSEAEYTSKEQAIFALAEYSDVGYEIIPALNAAWHRAETFGENPFQRARRLALYLSESQDADLLPKEL
jgi:hypothetical protein